MKTADKLKNLTAAAGGAAEVMIADGDLVLGATFATMFPGMMEEAVDNGMCPTELAINIAGTALAFASRCGTE